MFFLGTLSLLQIIVLPGLILLKLLKIRTGSAIQSSFYVFGLSLYSNYLIVCVLTYLRIYTPLSIYILFSIEIVGIIFFIIRGDIHLEL